MLSFYCDGWNRTTNLRLLRCTSRLCHRHNSLASTEFFTAVYCASRICSVAYPHGAIVLLAILACARFKLAICTSLTKHATALAGFEPAYVGIKILCLYRLAKGLLISYPLYYNLSSPYFSSSCTKKNLIASLITSLLLILLLLLYSFILFSVSSFTLTLITLSFLSSVVLIFFIIPLCGTY